MKPLYKEILFSTLLFVSAFIITCTIHEGGHAFFIKYSGLRGTWYHNYVDYDWSKGDRPKWLISCAGGLIFTLIQIVILLPIVLTLKSSNRFVQLFLSWLLFWALIVEIGYIMIGPIPVINDMSGIWELTKTPMWIRISVAAAGVFLFRFALGILKKPISYAMDATFSKDPKKQAQALILFTSFVATLLLILLNYPYGTYSYISVIFPLSTPLFVLRLYFRTAKDEQLQITEHKTTKGMWLAAVAIFILLVAVNRYFAMGVSF
jgi:hypothetical protein